MSRPRVSIVCLVWNQAALVEATVRSLCEQTWGNLEVLVADDGSTDGTQAVLQRLEREYPGRLHALLGAKNEGIARNTNRALLRATGDFVAFCGGDDLFLPEKIERQVAHFEAHPELVLSAHDAEYFDGATGEVRGHHSDLVRPQRGHGPVVLLQQGSIFHAITVMLRRSAVPAYGVDERVPIANDYKLWLDVLAGGGAYEILPDVLARYRLSGTNVTATRADAIWREGFVTLGLVEAAHPHLAAYGRQSRERLLFSRGVDLVVEEPEEARRWLLRSLSQAPLKRRSWPVWFAATLLPAPLRQRFVEALRAARRR